VPSPFTNKCRIHGCLPLCHEPPIFQIDRFATLPREREEKTLLIAPCALGNIKRCVRNRSYDTHDIILIAEDVLIRVLARLVLIGKHDGLSDGLPFHVFHVAELHVFRYEGVVRDGLKMSFFLPYRKDSALFPGPEYVFVQMDSLSWEWYQQLVDSKLSFNDSIRKRAAQSKLPLERSVPLSYQRDVFNVL
jgi:hypothetical protein